MSSGRPAPAPPHQDDLAVLAHTRRAHVARLDHPVKQCVSAGGSPLPPPPPGGMPHLAHLPRRAWSTPPARPLHALQASPFPSMFPHAGLPVISAAPA